MMTMVNNHHLEMIKTLSHMKNRRQTTENSFCSSSWSQVTGFQIKQISPRIKTTKGINLIHPTLSHVFKTETL